MQSVTEDTKIRSGHQIFNLTISLNHMSASIERCNLAPDLSISRILTGLWQIGDMEKNNQKLDHKATSAAMTSYVNAGFTTFDMADHYGTSEEIAGQFKNEKISGSEVQLFTKWVPKPGIQTRESVRSAVQLSLDRMKSDRLDLLQFHVWNYADPIWLDCLKWLQELKEEGLIRHLGLTNVDTAHLKVALQSGIEIVSNQVCFSLLDQRAGKEMTELCLTHGVRLLAFGTLAGGFLTERWLNKPDPGLKGLGTWSQQKYWRYIREVGGWGKFQNILQVMNKVAKKHYISIANVACRYILEQPAVAGIIVGARLGESEHIQDNLRLFQFSLDQTSKTEIKGTLEKLQIIPGDCGDEYRKPPFLTATGDLSDHLESIPSPYKVQSGLNGRNRILTGTHWEGIAGYSRAVSRGNQVWISGTTASHGDLLIGGDDPAAQTHFVIDKIEGVLQSFGGKLEDVIRTRVYVQNLADTELIARAHGERFQSILPANTFVQASLVGKKFLVEIDVDAILEGDNVPISGKDR